MQTQKSFFQLLKRERIKKKIYGTRDYIEIFYNSKRRHGSSAQMPPAEYENSIINGPEVSRLSVANQK
ncbi:IS3 family transposase [Salmonella enterica]|nr:IS3 family transposase [Salmonella enterica]EIB0034187.1 IS3 family transposase [Salmonella enterica]EJN2799624.1 IS3 family transposase [Salmonella enterica]ELH4024882.1 IS3 family transposase [Salmonella enterica]